MIVIFVKQNAFNAKTNTYYTEYLPNHNMLIVSSFLLGVITFSPHELPANVILPPRTTTSTKREHQTTIFIHFAPFCQEFR
jgi:hypothetical protein